MANESKSLVKDGVKVILAGLMTAICAVLTLAFGVAFLAGVISSFAGYQGPMYSALATTGFFFGAVICGAVAAACGFGIAIIAKRRGWDK